MNKCNNSINVPNMYNLGPLPQSDTLRRIYQGLQPQLLSNNCAGCNIIDPVTKCVTCKLGLYPAQQVRWNYGPSQGRMNCPVLVYLQAP